MMSLTTHPEEQVSTATASSSSLPSPTSSHTPHHEIDHTSSVLFSFLIVFLSIFGVAMLGGIVIHYVMARWRQLFRAELENIQQCRLRRQKPKMWDVQPELSAFLNHQPKWGALNPLSVQVDAPSSKENVHADEPFPRRPHPLTASLIRQLVYDVILHRPLAVPSEVAETTAPPALAAKVPTPGTGIHVAVLVAMPSPRHRTSVSRDSIMEIGVGGSEAQREYMIGTTRTYIQSP